MRRLLWVAAWLAAVAAGAQTQPECLAVLGSNEGTASKAAACARLRQVGTAEAVPALAALLADADLSHPARVALQAMPAPEAGAALRAALATTTGSLRIGVVDSLGVRREATAVGELARLLSDADPPTVAAAAQALGQIGPPALATLRRARDVVADAARPAVDRALVAVADALPRAEAAALYSELSAPDRPAAVRCAGYRGQLAGGDLALLARCLAGDDVAAQQAALQAIAQAPDAALARAAGDALGNLPATRRPAVLQALADRGDPSVLPAVLAALADDEPAVRLAALAAVAELGDASAVLMLAEGAGGRGAEARAARDALARLHRGPVDETILRGLSEASPATRANLARAAADRRLLAAVPVLLDQAARGDGAVRPAALEALAALAGDAEMGALVALLRGADDESRELAEAAAAAVIDRSADRATVIAPVLAAVAGTDSAARSALLRLAGAAASPAALRVVRAHLSHHDPAVREVAVGALAASVGPDSLPELLTIAREAGDAMTRIVALRGYWRLVGASGDRPATERLWLCRDGLAAAARAEERRMGLGALGRVALPEALEPALAARDDEAVRGEAELAAIQIATALLGTHRTLVEPVLRDLAATAGETVRPAAEQALATLTQRADYLMPWLVCGPYREAGRECQALFDIPFGPELPNLAVDWQPCISPPDPLLFWQVDLGPRCAGYHCVVYAKTRVWVPTAQAVALAIGVDDGIKVWLNGEQVHGNNAVRGLTPDEDKAGATLRAGWNDVLVKVTQHTVGCGFCLKLTTPDGRPVEGLKVDPLAP